MRSSLNTNIVCNMLLPFFSLFCNNLSTKVHPQKKKFQWLPVYLSCMNPLLSSLLITLGFFNSMACGCFKIVKSTWPHFPPLLIQLKPALVPSSHPVLVNVNNIHSVTQLSIWKLSWLLFSHIQLVNNSVTFISQISLNCLSFFLYPWSLPLSGFLSSYYLYYYNQKEMVMVPVHSFTYQILFENPCYFRFWTKSENKIRKSTLYSLAVLEFSIWKK